MPCHHDEYEILKQRGRQVTAKCTECGEIFSFVKEKAIPVDVVVNRHESSQKAQIRMEPSHMFKVDDIVDVNGEKTQLNSIECEGLRRVTKAEAKDVKNLWVISLDHPYVAGLSIHLPHTTVSHKVSLKRSQMFKVGDVVQVGTTVLRVTNLMTITGKRKSAFGDEIKRIYGVPAEGLAKMIIEVYNGESSNTSC